MSAPISSDPSFRRLVTATEILHRHGEGTFQDRVISACTELFPDSYSAFELWDRKTGHHTGAFNVPYDASNLVERFQRIGELVPTQHPCFPLIECGVASPLRLSDLTTERDLRRTEFYEVAFAPVDVRHQTAIPIHTATHLGGVTVSKGGHHDFTDLDLEIAGLFGRHLLVAHESARILESVRVQRPHAESQDHLALRRAGFSRRESEVFLWMAQGKRDREIAVILGISYRTVTNHVHAILLKTGAETRTAAVAAMQPL